MAREFKRTDRLADAIQRILAQLIQMEVRDPRVGMANINQVEVSRDLSFARVYVTVVGAEDDKRHEEAVAALNNAAGYLRGLLSRQLDIRVTPRLQFFYDKAAVHGQALSSLIDQAVAADKSKSDDADEDQAL